MKIRYIKLYVTNVKISIWVEHGIDSIACRFIPILPTLATPSYGSSCVVLSASRIRLELVLSLANCLVGWKPSPFSFAFLDPLLEVEVADYSFRWSKSAMANSAIAPNTNNSEVNRYQPSGLKIGPDGLFVYNNEIQKKS